MITDKEKPVTIKSIAERLGISAATVSYVLSDKAEKMKIPARTVERIKGMAENLGYVPNYWAKSLRTQKTKTIGIIFGSLGWSWSERVLKGILDVVDPLGYIPVMTVSFWDPEREREELKSLLERQVDGIICQPASSENVKYYRQVASQIPFVFLGDTFDTLASVSHVVWDSARAAEAVVRHLIAQGYQKIGFIGGAHRTLMTEIRYQSYLKTLETANLPINKDWIVWEGPGVLPDKAIENLFAAGKERPDALFFLNDSLALSALTKLDLMGLRVPQDVAVIGMGNLEMTGYSRISLSAVSEPCEELGKQAAASIIELVKNLNRGPIHRIIEGTELMARMSTRRCDLNRTDL